MSARAETVCSVPVCDRRGNEGGMCHAHYEWCRRNPGLEPTHAIVHLTVEERFWAKVEKRDDDCWIWQGATAAEGRYGMFQYQGRVRPAHRAAYLMFVGPIPEGAELDHLCRVTLCVNPAHLEPVSHYENVMRGEALQARNARKTHCIRGHELPPYERGVGRHCAQCRQRRNWLRRLGLAK